MPCTRARPVDNGRGRLVVLVSWRRGQMGGEHVGCPTVSSTSWGGG